MKKRAVWILALLLIAGLLAGCGGLTEDKAVGTWTASWELEGKQFASSLKLKENGSFERTISQDGYPSELESGTYEITDGKLICRLSGRPGVCIEFSYSGAQLKNGLCAYKKTG